MKIYSKFHDYYDIGLQYGIDPNCVYSRTTTRIDGFDKERVLNTVFSISSYDRSLFDRMTDIVMVVFCGKLYFATRFSKQINAYKTEEYYFYDFSSYEKYIHKNYKENEYAKFFNLSHWTSRGKVTAEDVMEKYPIKDQKLTDLLIEFGVPAIRIYSCSRYYEVELNPVLKGVQFYKALDPYTTFQEISMFISGVMGGSAPPMVQVSDVIRLEKHGFDKVTSFRKGKGE